MEVGRDLMGGGIREGNEGKYDHSTHIKLSENNFVKYILNDHLPSH